MIGLSNQIQYANYLPSHLLCHHVWRMVLLRRKISPAINFGSYISRFCHYINYRRITSASTHFELAIFPLFPTVKIRHQLMTSSLFSPGGCCCCSCLPAHILRLMKCSPNGLYLDLVDQVPTVQYSSGLIVQTSI